MASFKTKDLRLELPNRVSFNSAISVDGNGASLRCKLDDQAYSYPQDDIPGLGEILQELWAPQDG